MSQAAEFGEKCMRYGLKTSKTKSDDQKKDDSSKDDSGGMYGFKNYVPDKPDSEDGESTKWHIQQLKTAFKLSMVPQFVICQLL